MDVTTEFGNWSFDPAHGILTHSTPPIDIELWQLHNSSTLLHQIYQIQANDWAKPEDIGALVAALVFIFGWEMCEGGTDRAFDAKLYLKEKFGTVIEDIGAKNAGLMEPDEPWE